MILENVIGLTSSGNGLQAPIDFILKGVLTHDTGGKQPQRRELIGLQYLDEYELVSTEMDASSCGLPHRRRIILL